MEIQKRNCKVYLLSNFFAVIVIWSMLGAAAYATDAAAPLTTVSPWMGTYRDAQNVTLTCNDGVGPGCGTTYYCLGSGCTPDTVYSGPINISSSTTLRFYSKDAAGNSEPVRSYDYTIDPTLAYRFERLWPQLDQPWYFNDPSGVATDTAGNIYVADRGNKRVQKLDSNGNFVANWGSQVGTGQLYSPAALTVDVSSNVFVVDNCLIVKFDGNGNFITQWGSQGSGNGQFVYPEGLAVDSSGNVYVADSHNDRIQKFDSNGTYLTQWGTPGSGNGQFNLPTKVATDGSSNIYVADYNNYRIQKFDINGNYLTQWGSHGYSNGQFNYIYGIATETSGNIYVADADGRIQMFTNTGAFLSKISYSGSGIPLDGAGNFYTFDNSIKRFSNSGTLLAEWGASGNGSGQLSYPAAVAVTANGNVYVAENANNRIQLFDSNGNYTVGWGTYGSGDGQFYSITGMAVDANSNVYVADQSNGRIQKFDQNGNYLLQWGDGMLTPYGVAVDASANVYVTDSNNLLKKFDSLGNILAQWGGYGTGNGQFYAPKAVAIDAGGNIYVADSGNQRIQKFDSNGNYLLQWGSYGTGAGQFISPQSITVDGGGNVHVADALNNRIQKFDSNGNLLAMLRSSGSGNGQFKYPNGVAVDGLGNVYVADTNNHRIQKFNSAINPAIELPGVPTEVTASAGDGWATISFSPPTNSAGSAFLYYTVTSTPDNIVASGTAAPITITGLTRGTSYTFTVTATNALGTGPASLPSNSVTPNVSYALNLNVAGSGIVSSLPSPDMNCSGSCTQAYPSGTIVTLTATPTSGSIFTGWNGTCSSVSGNQCSILMDSAKSITATFNTNREMVASGLLRGASTNSLGEVVWSQSDPPTGKYQIYSSTRGQLTNDAVDHYDPAINNLGDLVWVERSCDWSCVNSIKGIIGGIPVSIASSQNDFAGKIDLNDRGEVVWVQQETMGYSQVYSNIRGQVTTGDGYRSEPAINNQGDVVFSFLNSMVTGSPWRQVYRLAAGSTAPVAVTSDNNDHPSVTISDSGEILWSENPGGAMTASVVSSTRGVLVPAADVYGMDVNSCGDIIYIVNENGQYNLYRLGSNAPCATHPEPNHTQEQATQVAFGDIFTGVMDSTTNPQIDWYRFEATAGDTIHITVNYQRPPNWLMLEVIDGHGNRFNPTMLSDFVMTAPANMTGTYYLRVEGAGGTRFGYSVSLSKYTTNCGVGPCPDEVASNVDPGASINSLGEVVWSQYQIFSSQRGQLTGDPVPHYSVANNNMGDLAWVEGNCDPYPSVSCSYVIKGIIGGVPATIATNLNWKQAGKIDLNDRGEVVWTQQDAMSNYQVYSNLRGQLTKDPVDHFDPSINNQGDLAFILLDPLGPGQVYKLSAGSTMPLALTSNSNDKRTPSISDNGEVVWGERNMLAVPAVSSVVSSTRGVLLSGAGFIESVDVNNCGDVIYVTNENGPNKLYRLGSSAPCVSHPEPNNTQEQATPVAFGDIFTGLMDNTTNPVVAWYRFDATAGDTIHITVNYDRRPENPLNLQLIDGHGNYVNGTMSYDPLGITAPAYTTGPYYLRMDGWGGRFGYSVSLSKYSTNCGIGPCQDLVASNVDFSTSINSLGEVVWSQYDQFTGKNNLFSSQRNRLTGDVVDHNSPAINSLGDLVWVEHSDSNYTLRGTIAGQPTVIATTQDMIGKTDINDRQEVVWDRPDWNGNNRIYSNIRGPLTDGSKTCRDPSINNQGEVVFLCSDAGLPGSVQIYRVAGGSTAAVAVTSENVEYRSPAINDSGEIIWGQWDFGGRTMQLVSNTRGIVMPVLPETWNIDFNNCGDIVYTTLEPSGSKLYRLGLSAPCVTHPEPNDTQEQATPVAFGDIFTGVMDSTANPVVAWYRFEATAGDTIHITINYDRRPQNMLQPLQLVDGYGNWVNSTMLSDSVMTAQAYTTGPYYLRLEGYGGRFGYSVSLSKYSNNCGVGPCPEVVASNVDFSTSITSLGEVVWSQLDQSTGKNQIFSSQRGQLTSDAVDHLSPAINNLGDLVWVEHSDSSYTLRGTIAGQPTVIANTQERIGKTDINDRREVVWDRPDWNGNNRVYSNIRGPLTDGTKICRDPSINGQGDVVFLCSDPAEPSTMQVYRVAGGSTTAEAVTNQTLEYRSPAINDSGEIIWGQRDFSGTTMQLVSSVRGVVVPVLPETWNIDFNNCGDIVYTTLEPSGSKLYRLGLSAPCVTHPEPNHTQEQATPVALGDIFTGLMNGTVQPSTDWYRFEATAGDNIHIIVNYDRRPSNALEIQLYGEQGPFTGHTSDDPLGIDVSATSTGSYYLLIQGWGGRTGYSVSISATRPADTVAPATAATPAGGTNVAPQTVTLSCSDGAGSGCAATYYCLGTGCNPTTPYSGGIAIAISTDLRFYSTDRAGNSEEVNTATYTINNLIKVDDITATFFATIQAACDDTATDRIIKLRNSLFNEQIVFNRPKTLTLRGGYDVSYDFADGFTTINGSMTIADGTVIIDGIILQ